MTKFFTCLGSKATGSLAAFVILSSSPALAAMDLQLFGGSRSAQWEYEKEDETKHEKPVTSTELGLALHVNPFKKAPISFGLTVQQNDFDLAKAVKDQYEDVTIESDDGIAHAIENSTANLKGLTYGPEVMAWIPMLKDSFRLFLRLGYTVGTYDVIADFKAGPDVSAKTEDNYKVSGTHYGLGFIYAPAKHFGFLVEYSLSQQTMDVQKGKVTFTTPAGSETIDMKTEDYDDEDKSTKLESAVARVGFNFSF